MPMELVVLKYVDAILVGQTTWHHWKAARIRLAGFRLAQ